MATPLYTLGRLKADYLTIIIDEFDYSIPKRESNVTGGKAIELIHSKPIGTSKVSRSKLTKFLTTVKTAKDKLQDVVIEVDDDFNWSTATLYFVDKFRSTISIRQVNYSYDRKLDKYLEYFQQSKSRA